MEHLLTAFCVYHYFALVSMMLEILDSPYEEHCLIERAFFTLLFLAWLLYPIWVIDRLRRMDHNKRIDVIIFHTVVIAPIALCALVVIFKK
jgi:small-conductance mechanosensitive channel